MAQLHLTAVVRFKKGWLETRVESPVPWTKQPSRFIAHVAAAVPQQLQISIISLIIYTCGSIGSGDSSRSRMVRREKEVMVIVTPVFAGM
jgi:hypothetical protein